jgi:hypothetical protein
MGFDRAIAGGELLLIRVEAFEVLLQHEEVLGAVVAGQGGHDLGLRRVEGFRTTAERTRRLGRTNSVHTPATRRSASRRLGARRRERLRISSCCLTRTDSATTARAPPGAGEPGDGRQEVEQQDSEVAHATIPINRAKSEKC